MAIVSRGTELGSIAEIVPGAIQSGPSTGIANKGSGQPIAPPVADIDYGIILLTAKQGFPRNLAGASITDYDLGGTNSNFSSILASKYPGAAIDDNDIQWEVPVPPDMDPTDPQITVILHFLIPS